MNMVKNVLRLGLVLQLGLAACSNDHDSHVDGGPDAGLDGGMNDGGMTDGGHMDGGGEDASTPDAGGPTDASVHHDAAVNGLDGSTL